MQECFARSRRRGRLLAAAMLASATAGIVVSAALAAASKPVVLSDASKDVNGPLDIVRASLRRASDGQLRAVASFAEPLTPKTLLATSGPPGAACVRVWTAANADPSASRPDRLVCVTARSQDELRGGVYEVKGADLPKRVANASVKRAAGGRNIVMRFTQSSIGRPRRIRFAIESTRPGCERADCIDKVPDGAGTRRFRLR